MSRSCQSRSCCLLDVLEIVIDSVMDPTFHMTISHTGRSNVTSKSGEEQAHFEIVMELTALIHENNIYQSKLGRVSLGSL